MHRALTPTVVLTARFALLATALLVVLAYRIGPVVLTVTPSHGMHLGDLLAVPPVLAAAALPRRRLRMDRRVGVKAPLTPNPMRRASDRA